MSRIPLAFLVSVALALALPAAGSADRAPGCLGRPATIVGSGPVRGTTHADVIVTGAGSDRIDGRGGNDRICSGGGDDRIEGGAGSDRVAAGPGDDEVPGGNGSDRVHGGSGADVLIGDRGNDELYGGGGERDFVNGSLGDDIVSGGGGDFDQVVGSVGNDVLHGGDGDGDVLRGDYGSDTIDGGPGEHDAASYAVSGTLGQVLGGRGVEVELDKGVARNDGNDELSGIEDVIGTPFSDRIVGGPGPNSLYGASGGDQLIGDGAGDAAFGGVGGDRCGGFESELFCELHGVTGANPEAEALLLAGNPTPKPRLQVDLAGGPGATSLAVVVASGFGLHDGPGVVTTVSFANGAWTVGESRVPIEVGDDCELSSSTEAVCPVSGRPDAVLLSGSAGDDTLEVSETVPDTVTAVIEGEDGADELIGGPGDDSLEGNGRPHADVLDGRGGDDALADGKVLEGGAGSDLLIADGCNGEEIEGGGGVDSVSFARTQIHSGIEASLDGTAGFAPNPDANPPFPGGCPSDPAFSPTLIGASVESIEGSPYDDVLSGDGGDNILLGRGGDDTLQGEGGGDFLVGGLGRDALFGDAGFDRLHAIDSARDVALDCGGGPAGGVASADPGDPAPRACRDRPGSS